MFFRRTSKNRRFERDYVLDVKLRSSQVRAARGRMVGMAMAIIFAVGLGGYVLWRAGGWGLEKLIYENPAFALLELDLQTDGVIAVEQLKAWAGVKTGQNLFALDLARVTRNLESIPFVQSASVERILPHKLKVRVSEREPIAQINLSHQRPSGLLEPVPFNLDEEGCVMPGLAPQQRAVPPSLLEQMPLIVGVSTAQLRPGQMLEAPQGRAALQLVQAFDRSSMAGVVELKKVDASSSDVLIATTGQGSEITFRPVDLDQQMRRWFEIQDYAQRQGKVVASLDLAVSNHIPARWIEASALPPSPPRPAKTQHYKKKHV